MQQNTLMIFWTIYIYYLLIIYYRTKTIAQKILRYNYCIEILRYNYWDKITQENLRKKIIAIKL